MKEDVRDELERIDKDFTVIRLKILIFCILFLSSGLIFIFLSIIPSFNSNKIYIEFTRYYNIITVIGSASIFVLIFIPYYLKNLKKTSQMISIQDFMINENQTEIEIDTETEEKIKNNETFKEMFKRKMDWWSDGFTIYQDIQKNINDHLQVQYEKKSELFDKRNQMDLNDIELKHREIIELQQQIVEIQQDIEKRKETIKNYHLSNPENFFHDIHTIINRIHSIIQYPIYVRITSDCRPFSDFLYITIRFNSMEYYANIKIEYHRIIYEIHKITEVEQSEVIFTGDYTDLVSFYHELPVFFTFLQKSDINNSNDINIIL